MNPNEITAADYRKLVKSKKSAGAEKLYDEICKVHKNWVREFKFSESRKFRADYADPLNRILVEYEGIHSKKSGHTTKTGYNSDLEKYNLAAVEGWKVLRYSANNYKNAVSDLTKIYSQLKGDESLF